MPGDETPEGDIHFLVAAKSFANQITFTLKFLNDFWKMADRGHFKKEGEEEEDAEEELDETVGVPVRSA